MIGKFNFLLANHFMQNAFSLAHLSRAKLFSYLLFSKFAMY